MCALPDRTGRENYGQISWNDASAGATDRQEDLAGPIDQREELLKKKLIETICNKISLAAVFTRFGLDFESVYSNSGWTHKANCPFPDHTDANASFGYNENDDRFHCFGCNRSGRSVHFMAAMESISALDAAKKLINGNISLIADELNKNLFRFDYKRLDTTLFDFSTLIREMRVASGLAFYKYSEAIAWSLDCFLMQHPEVRTINLNELEIRIRKLTQKLESFKEPDELE